MFLTLEQFTESVPPSKLDLTSLKDCLQF